MSEIKVIDGEIHRDYRGFICSLNAFHFEGVERGYFIHHPDESIVRGWHGHQHERKWFYCVKGRFSLAFVKIDDWYNPSPDLVPEIFELDESDSRIICLPAGYANCIKAHDKDSILMVLSDKILEVAELDSWRYPNTLWVDWAR